jgi:orotate phosphoribosyltransferase
MPGHIQPTAELREGLMAYTLEGDFVLSNFQASRRFTDAGGLAVDRKYAPLLVGAIESRAGSINAVAALSWSPASIILSTLLSQKLNVPLMLVEPPQYAPVGDPIQEFPLRGPKRIKGTLDEAPTAAIIGDVCVTGASLLHACRCLSRVGWRPKPIAILDRERGGRALLAQEGYELAQIFSESEVWQPGTDDPLAPLSDSAIQASLSRIAKGYPSEPRPSKPSPAQEREEWVSRHKEKLTELSEKFASYWRPIAIEDVVEFLGQLRTTGEMEDMLAVLGHVNFYSQEAIGEQIASVVKQLAEQTNEQLLVCPWGTPRDSGVVVSYLFEKSKGTPGLAGRIEVHDVHDAMRILRDRENSRLVFVDDIIQIGTQSTEILGQWLGEPAYLSPVLDHHTEPLAQEDREALKRQPKVYLATLIGFREGKDRVEKEAGRMGVNLSVVAGTELSEERGCFSVHETFFDPGDRDRVKTLCLDIGRNLLSDKRLWSDRKRESNALGYGNSEKLIVFSHNTPTSTVTCLWKSGIYHGTPWRPLFPRRS